MVDVKSKRCGQQGCTKQPSFGVGGSGRPEFCSEHKKDGMMNAKSRRCGQQGCTKHPSFGVGGSGRPEFCSAHKKDGMINVKNMRCGQQGCTKHPSFGVDGGGRPEFCSEHKMDGMVDVKSKRRGQQVPPRNMGSIKRARRAPADSVVAPIPVEAPRNEITIPSEPDEPFREPDGVKTEPGAFRIGRRGSWR